MKFIVFKLKLRYVSLARSIFLVLMLFIPFAAVEKIHYPVDSNIQLSYDRPQHFRVKVTFYLLRAQYSWRHCFYALKSLSRLSIFRTFNSCVPSACQFSCELYLFLSRSCCLWHISETHNCINFVFVVIGRLHSVLYFHGVYQAMS